MFAIVFQQVFIMFLLMLIGFVYAKATGMQKAECNRICNILLMIVTPCLLLSNLQRPFQQEIVKELLFSLGLAVVSSLFAILAARFLFLPRGQQENKRIERYAASFGNVGFIGIPLVTGIFGAQYAVFAVVFVVVFHVLSWTVGVGMLKGYVLERSAVESGDTQRSGSGAVVCDEHYAAFLFGGGSRVPFFFEHAAGYAGMRILYCGGGLEPVSGKRGAIRLSDPAGMDSAFDHAAVLGIGTAPLDR